MSTRHSRTMHACLLVLACLLMTGCSRDKDAATAGGAQLPGASDATGAAPEAQDGERTWVGLLPCSDCQGVDTRLVLRSHAGRRDYLLTETYLGGTGKNVFTREGNWSELSEPVDGEALTIYVLDPEQGGQRFSLQADGALELLDGDGKQPAQAVVYRLQRL